MSRTSNQIDLIDVHRIVNARVDAAGGEAAFARAHGLSRQLVHQATSAGRKPSQMVLTACGIRRVVEERYEIEDAA